VPPTAEIPKSSVGATFATASVIDTVAAAESNVPSLTLNVNESVPFTLVFGV
jgi:hypothetical protein